MKPHYFDQAEADKDDIELGFAKLRRYVPPTCLLGGILVMLLTKEGKDPCRGCEAPRERCRGRSKV